MHSNNSNLDWELVDDMSIRLSQADGLERDRYLDFTKAKAGDFELVGSAKGQYTDS